MVSTVNATLKTKRIILLSDGTGNAVKNVWRTNVWRVFEGLDLTKPDQVACYADGVGTSSFKPLAILGGVFGWGLKRNVLHLYKFLCRNYEAGDEIYTFGFSRGAFTVRVLGGLIAHQGIVPFSSEDELERNTAAAYRAYRAARYETILKLERPARWLRDTLLAVRERIRGRKPYAELVNQNVNAIRFVGVWDTVAAYGLPIDEMTRGISQYVWPLELPNRTLSDKVQRACHAIAIDDERTTFHPVLWTEQGLAAPAPRDDGHVYLADERLSQVWFSGAHSNVGGGYPDDSLAYIPLVWMMREAAHCGLRFKKAPDADPDVLKHAESCRDPDGRLYDSRSGLGGYYRYGPRKIADLCKQDGVEIVLPKIHESVLHRSMDGAHIYAPAGFPSSYAVVNELGQAVATREPDPEARAAAQENAWDFVWKRRVVYFLTLIASFHLALFPLFHKTEREAEFSTPFRMISEAVRIAERFIPGFFKWWTDSYATNPGTFLIGAGAVAFFMLWGVRLGGKITGVMQSLWRTDGSPKPPLPSGLLYQFRTHTVYQLVIRAFRYAILPVLSVAAIVYVLVSVLSHVVFNMEDAAGLYCKETVAPQPVPYTGTLEAVATFRANDICWPSGILLTQGQRYQITVTQVSDEWSDGDFKSDIGGFEIAELPKFRDRIVMIAATPLRRVFLRPWYRLIARVGAVGTDEHFLDPDREALAQDPLTSYGSVFRSRRTGELFMYVNDVGSAIPFVTRWLYRNNYGEARVTVKHLPR